MVEQQEEKKLWLFDLAHGNLNDNQILRGFIKHYVLSKHSSADVLTDLSFTNYDAECCGFAMQNIGRILLNVAYEASIAPVDLGTRIIYETRKLELIGSD